MMDFIAISDVGCWKWRWEYRVRRGTVFFDPKGEVRQVFMLLGRLLRLFTSWHHVQWCLMGSWHGRGRWCLQGGC